MKKQNGIITLLTSFILSVILAAVISISISNSKLTTTVSNTVYERAKILNASNSALECAIQQINLEDNKDTAAKDVDISSCESIFKVSISLNEIEEENNKSEIEITVIADGYNVPIKKTINKREPKKLGNISSNSNITFNSSYQIRIPEKISKTNENEWICRILTYASKLTINGSIDNLGLIWNPQSDHENMECKDIENPMSSIEKSPSLNPFEEFFGTSDTSLVEKGFHGITVSENAGKCGDEIVEALNFNYERIWVNGNCVIEKSAFGKIAEKSQDLNGIMIVVNNGIFGIEAQSSEAMKAILFLKNEEHRFNLQDWKDTSFYNFISHTPPVAEGANEATFFFSGSAIMRGNIILDTLDPITKERQHAVFYSSIISEFDQDLFEKFSNSRQGSNNTNRELFEWKQGSWMVTN